MADRPEIKTAGRYARLNLLSEVSLTTLRHVCRSGRPLFATFWPSRPDRRRLYDLEYNQGDVEYNLSLQASLKMDGKKPVILMPWGRASLP